MEGHLLDSPPVGSLQLKGQARTSSSLEASVSILRMVQCQVLFMTASKALTNSFSKVISKDRRDLRDLEDRRGRGEHKDSLDSLDSPDHKVNQVSPDYLVCKDSRGHKDLRGLRGIRDRRDFKDRRGRKGHRDRKGHEGQVATESILHQTFCLRVIMSSLKA